MKKEKILFTHNLTEEKIINSESLKKYIEKVWGL